MCMYMRAQEMATQTSGVLAVHTTNRAVPDHHILVTIRWKETEHGKQVGGLNKYTLKPTIRVAYNKQKQVLNIDIGQQLTYTVGTRAKIVKINNNVFKIRLSPCKCNHKPIIIQIKSVNIGLNGKGSPNCLLSTCVSFLFFFDLSIQFNLN